MGQPSRQLGFAGFLLSRSFALPGSVQPPGPGSICRAGPYLITMHLAYLFYNNFISTKKN